MARVLTGTPSESRNKLMIAAAVMFAVIAAILLFVALQNAGGGDGPSGVTADVAVANQTVNANTRLTADMLSVQPVPVEQVLTGAYRDIESLVGLPVRFPLQKGEQVTTSKVGIQAIEDERDLGFVLEPGQRGFAVEVTEVTAVGGLLLPGNVTDVIAAFDGDTAGIPKAVTVLQNIKVVSVGQLAQEPVPAGTSQTEDGEANAEAEVGEGVRDQRPDELERQPRARSVTLAVTPEEAQLLAVLQSAGAEIWLSLRPAGDAAGVELNESNLLRFLTPAPPQP